MPAVFNIELIKKLRYRNSILELIKFVPAIAVIQKTLVNL